MALFSTVENYLDAEVRLKKLDLVIKMTKKGQSILHRHSVRIGIPINRILDGYEDRSVLLDKAVNEPFQAVRSEIAG